MEESYMIVIGQDGKVEKKPLDIENTLECLQHEVKGWIERVPFGSYALISEDMNVDMWVNEEGLYIDGFRTNIIAMGVSGYPHLVGPAVLTKSSPDGATIGFTEKEAYELRKRIVGE